MALMESTMMALGTEAPDFTLPDTTKHLEHLNLRRYTAGAQATLVMFICNHCPYVVHVQEQLAALGRDFEAQGVKLIAISSNDVVRYAADSPALMTTFAQDNGFTFPYLYDESQDVAKAYDAVCTPDFFLFDSNLKLTYRGRLDASRPGSGLPVTGEDMRMAIEQTLAGSTIAEDQQYPSAGCSIKWKE